jgi:FtsH-binding integral membrane protein
MRSDAVANAVGYAPADVRADFIRRVYSLFFLSALVTVSVAAICAQPAIAPGMLTMMPLLAIGTFVCILVMAFARRAAGLNFFLFYLFAALEGAIVGPLLTLINQTAPGVPAEAAWITISVFGGLTLYAMQSGKDFSYLGGMLFVGLIGLIVAGIVMFFVHAAIMYTVYCLFGILIFCGYILYDTSRILLRLEPGDEIVGAISLYLDLLNLFWFILDLLLSMRKD